MSIENNTLTKASDGTGNWNMLRRKRKKFVLEDDEGMMEQNR